MADPRPEEVLAPPDQVGRTVHRSALRTQSSIAQLTRSAELLAASEQILKRAAHMLTRPRQR